MSTGQVTRHDDGDVAILTLDVPGTRVNTVTDRTFVELGDQLAGVVADTGVIGAVLASAKPHGFCAGADIRRLPELAASPDPRPVVQAAHRVVSAMTASAKPLVAALHGAALGAGLELALACHSRIATDHEGTRFGLPEVKLGLLPAAGGTQHLPRLLPLPSALEYLLTGKTMYPRRARALGLLDGVVPANQLARTAVARVRALAAGVVVSAPREPPAESEIDEVLGAARALAAEQARGLYPAPERIIDVVEVGLRQGLEAGLAAERDAFTALLRTPEAAAAIHLYLAGEEARGRAPRADGDVRKLFVLGGGSMGAGIAAVAVDRGLHARVRDPDEAAHARVRRHVEGDLRRRYGKRGDAFAKLYRERVHLLSVTADLSGLATADLVVESVFEGVCLKADVLREAEVRMRPDAVLASNTSAIPITRLADACARPERFCGMHFFSPVERRPLVEIVPHDGTSAATLQRALAAVRQLGKVPVVVADSPGFYTSRVFGRWLGEAVRLLLAGARIEHIDAAASALGFPLGPMAAYDEVSLELAHDVAANPDLAAVTGRHLDTGVVSDVIGALVEAGHVGRRGGLGFYHYDAAGRRGEPAARVYDVVGAAPAGEVDPGELADRLLYAFLTEALACFDEHLLRSPGDGDVAAVLGIGFPPNLGGPFHYVDRAGAAQVLERATALDRAHGGFAPGRTLADLAGRGQRFADLGN